MHRMPKQVCTLVNVGERSRIGFREVISAEARVSQAVLRNSESFMPSYTQPVQYLIFFLTS
jgi:hypothetical protein